MADIERWTMYLCPICGHMGSTDVCAGPADHHALVPRPAVEVVRADIHAGAVEALRALVEASINVTEVRDIERWHEALVRASDIVEGR